MKKIALLISGILLTITFSFSQTHIPGGNVNGTWTSANSPYIIDGDIEVNAASTLTIDPGVEVTFSDNYRLDVYGQLLAIGTETDSIFFYHVNPLYYWDGLDFVNLDLISMDSSRIQYCHFFRADGAILCDISSKVNISNSLFLNNIGNSAGDFGGIKCENSSPRIDQVTITGSDVECGGGMYITTNSNPYITNSTITENEVLSSGGGIFIDDHSNPIFYDVEISWNTATITYASKRGSGIFIRNHSNPEFYNVDIIHNTCINSPYGSYGGGVAIIDTCNPVLTNVVIAENEADFGGGIYVKNSVFHPICTNVIIKDNDAGYETIIGSAGGGAGIFISDCDASLQNILICENVSIADGGGIYCDNSNLTLDHVTITRNNAVYFGNGIYNYESDIILDNSIVWHNVSADSYYQEGTATFNATYSNIEGGSGQSWFGTGCKDEDPLFVNWSGYDFRLSWPGFPYDPRSVCISGGDPSYPLDPDGTRNDMGAIPFIYSEGTLISSGNYCGTWNSDDSPFIVEGEVNVPVGCELAIQHGVQVIFWRREAINVYGRILAEGLSWDKIIFTDGDSHWKGIKFYNTNTNGQDSSLIEYAEIKQVAFEDPDFTTSGGGLYFENSSDVNIRNCEIRDCLLYGYLEASGAGITCYGSSPKIHDIIIHSCKTEANRTYGTAIYCHTNSNPEITRALIYNNDSEATDYARGGGIACVNSDPILTNITITQNNMIGSNQYGGAIYADGSDPVISSCIFYDNDNAEIYLEPDAFPVITYSNIEGGTGQPWFGTGCIDADPLFFDPSPGVYDFHLSWDNFPVEDATKSPCIDTGDPSSPTDPDGTQADMGFYPFYQAYWLCGDVYGTLAPSGSPYIVNCNVNIPSTESLTIVPGVEVIFMGNYKFEVHGQLFAEGTETDSIHFRPFDFATGWHGIRFFNTEINGQPPSLLKYCDISGGLAFDDYSGGIDEWGGAVLCYNSSDVEISNSTIQNNRAFGSGLGGGIYCSGSDITIDSVNIYNNYAGYGGGGICLYDSDPAITRTIIAGNYASATGAGILIRENSSPTITNVTISDNNGSLNGGIGIWDASPTIKNSIIWNNENGIHEMGTTSSLISFSVVEGGWPGAGNVDGYPLLADPSNYDFSLTWENYPEPDETRSSAIDMGDPSSPSDPDGTRNDIGAIYFEQTYTAIPGGNISGTLYCADSPYYVFGDLTVPTGEELIIEPCVYVGFQGEFKLTVNGRLLAEGTETDRITFYPADTITGWGGIRFYNQNTNGQDSSKLVHCRILHGNADVPYSHDGNGGGVYFNNSSDVLIDSCLFLKNRAITSGGALYITQSTPVIRNSVFEWNSALNGGAIHCYDNVNTTFLNCSFSNNIAEKGGAVMVFSDTPGFSGCSMVNNRATKFGGAIYHSAYYAPVFDDLNRCNIYDNYADYAGLDFYSDVSVLDIYLDTASVTFMNKHFAYPYHLFNIYSNNSRFVQENSNLYVSTTGSDANSGTSAAVPLATIKMALIKIIADDSDPKTIYVANGTYSTYMTSETLPINHRSYVTLSGESRTNTIIDGDSLTRLLISYDDINDSVSNLTIQIGYKDGDGGAVVIEDYSNPVFYNVTFKDNTCTNNGGAIWCTDYCYPMFSNTNFLNNYSDNSGGALYFQSNDTIIFDQVMVDNNASRGSGGGIYAHNNDYIQVTNSFISANGVINGGGGGVILRGGSYNFFGVTFISNTATGGGGGGLYVDYHADLEIKHSSFIGNEASTQGGGLYFYVGVDINMENVVFSSNISLEGGAIFGWYNSSININNGLFYSNTAYSYPGLGGAMSLNDLDADLNNLTLTYNMADEDGGGLYIKASSGDYDYTIQNSIVYSNGPDQIFEDNLASANVDYCNIQDGWPTGTGNISSYPDFVDAGSANFRLNPGSPCINAGKLDTTGMNLPMFDLGDDPRISLDTLDMGAYEYFHGIELDLKAILEGPYNGATMNTYFSGHSEPVEGLPLQQPYSFAPWNYSGAEEITTLSFENVVDWISVEVRDTTNVSLASPESIVGRQAVFLLDDGTMVDINGNNIKFGNPVEHQCFVTLYHRNHLGVISAYPLIESGGVYNYDFTTPAGQAHGTDAQKDLGGGIYGLYGGDGNADGTINEQDKTAWTNQVGKAGYLQEDFQFDGEVNNQDKNDILINNTGNSSQIPA